MKSPTMTFKSNHQHKIPVPHTNWRTNNTTQRWNQKRLNRANYWTVVSWTTIYLVLQKSVKTDFSLPYKFIVIHVIYSRNYVSQKMFKKPQELQTENVCPSNLEQPTKWNAFHFIITCTIPNLRLSPIIHKCTTVTISPHSHPSHANIYC